MFQNIFGVYLKLEQNKNDLGFALVGNMRFTGLLWDILKYDILTSTKSFV